MTTSIRMSTRGRVVVPKRLRDRLGWREGLMLEVVVVDDGVELLLPAACGQSAFSESIRD